MAKTKYAKFKCPNCRAKLDSPTQVHNCRAMPPFKKLPKRPFGGVAFDPDLRRGGDPNDPTNAERAESGKMAVQLFAYLQNQPTKKGKQILRQIADLIDLTQEPEIPLTDLLANLMHYCHKNGIPWTGEDGVATWALVHFNAESGGAVL